MRIASRIDTNQVSIVRSLRQAGFHVFHTHTVGAGCPDAVISGYSNRTGRVEALLVEIKTEKGKLTPHEVEWHEDYPTDGPLIIARDVDDVLRWFGRL